MDGGEREGCVRVVLWKRAERTGKIFGTLNSWYTHTHTRTYRYTYIYTIYTQRTEISSYGEITEESYAHFAKAVAAEAAAGQFRIGPRDRIVTTPSFPYPSFLVLLSAPPCALEWSISDTRTVLNSAQWWCGCNVIHIALYHGSMPFYLASLLRVPQLWRLVQDASTVILHHFYRFLNTYN